MSTNDPQQQQMIREAMKAIAERRPGKTKLVYDKNKRTIVAVAENSNTVSALNITAEDADMFGVLTLTSRWLEDRWSALKEKGTLSIPLSAWDGGDAFTLHDIGVQGAATAVEGEIFIGESRQSDSQHSVRLFLAAVDPSTPPAPARFVAPDGTVYKASSQFSKDGVTSELDVEFVDIQPALDKRRIGILETSVLADTKVVLAGVGTGGAYAAVELAKCGVGHFALIDPDRLSVGNVVRHPGGISQVGRLKVNVVRDLILEKNPDARVDVYPIPVSHENLGVVRDVVRGANVVICGTDNRPSKLLLNRLCVEENVTAVYGGAFRRAYGGQVLRVRPKETLCYQCFVAAMPEESADAEISSEEEAAAVAYSDRPVAVEPGLSLDVQPIANLLTKLAVLELLKGRSTSLSLLNRDFDAPWYLWLNRPEPGTQYASWPPLSESRDEMTINRWYGVYIERDAECPVCGHFIAGTAAALGIDLASLGELPSEPPKN
jgi:molybdopterin/thiamine biosynthesis adenylyltransferase